MMFRERLREPGLFITKMGRLGRDLAAVYNSLMSGHTETA